MMTEGEGVEAEFRNSVGVIMMPMRLDPIAQGCLCGLLSENSSMLPGLWDPGWCEHLFRLSDIIVWGALVPLAGPALGQPPAGTHSREHLVCVL